MRFILTNEAVNSAGIIIMTNGLNVEEFKKNPVMLFNHDDTKIIGRWKDIRIENNAITAEPEFDEEDEFAMEIKRKVEKGYISGTSIGIIGKKSKMVNGILNITAGELREASIVALPSNKNTVKLSIDQANEVSEDLYIKCSVEKIIENMENIENENIEKTNENEITENVEVNENIEPINENEVEVNTEITLSAQIETFKTVINENQIIIANKDNEIIELKAKLETYEKQEQEREINDFISLSLNAGKITKDQVEMFTNLAKVDFSSVKSVIETMKPIASIQLSAQIETESIDAKSKWTLTEWDKNDPEGLQQMIDEDPERFHKLYQEDKKNWGKKW